jgi:hypothetical protein
MGFPESSESQGPFEGIQALLMSLGIHIGTRGRGARPVHPIGEEQCRSFPEILASGISGDPNDVLCTMYS